MDKAEKLKRIQEARVKVEKEFGKGVLMTLNEKPIVETEVISTGSIKLDTALGVGGLPKGRIIEIYGPESSGKTTIAIHVIAEAQKKGGTALLIDAEHAFDRTYAEKLGVNIDEMMICQPDYGEQALEVADKMISSGGFDIVVIDSVAALVPKAELEGEMGDSKMGLHARLMSQALRKLTATIAKTNTMVIFINQLREKIGVMFGNPETTTGGNALKYYASVRLDIRRSISGDNMVKSGDTSIGNLTKVKVIKNKVAPPFKTAEFDILFGIGIDKIGELLEVAVDTDVIQKGGSWYSYKGAKLGQGAENVKQILRDNPEMIKEVRELVNEKLNG
jgi:recombination protein RecA